MDNPTANNHTSKKKRITSKVVIPPGMKFSKTTQTITRQSEPKSTLPPPPIHANGNTIAAALDEAAAIKNKNEDGIEDLTPLNSRSPSPNGINVSATPPLDLKEYFQELGGDKNKEQSTENIKKDTNNTDGQKNNNNTIAPIQFHEFMQNPINPPRRTAFNNRRFRANSYVRGGSHCSNNPRFHHSHQNPYFFPNQSPIHHHRHQFLPARQSSMNTRGGWRGRGAAFFRGGTFSARGLHRGCSCHNVHGHYYYY